MCGTVEMLTLPFLISRSGKAHTQLPSAWLLPSIAPSDRSSLLARSHVMIFKYALTVVDVCFLFKSVLLGYT